MRLYRVTVHNYKRLVETGFFINGKLTALVGPNEAGKTSVIQSLKLMSNNLDVAKHLLNRATTPTDQGPVLSCDFVLEAKDQHALEGVPLATPLKRVRLMRRANGTTTWSYEPAPEFDPQVSLAAASALIELDHVLDSARPPEDAEEDVRTQFNDMIAGYRQRLADCREAILVDDVETDAEQWAARRAVIVQAASDARWRDQEVLDKFDRFVATVASGASAWRFVTDALTQRQPSFVEFTAAHRDLQFEYNVEEIKQADRVPPALANLLAVAGVDFDALYETLDSNSRRETLIDEANDRLDEFFARAWTQSRQTIAMRIKGETLELYVRELGAKRATVDLSERSDGLRTYVALILFLEARSERHDIILLIDEAELHLHYDAQADLLNRLSENTFLTRVIYTTHSPGCLPRDLGTGVRFVVPDNDNQALSAIRHDFWKLGEAAGTGFSPLLLAMGASAATFAHVRQAVVGEGPSEMLLLPSLIKKALTRREGDVPDLTYQVAPGIAIHASSEFAELREIAVNTAFLVDGDKQGDIWKQQLMDAGVPGDRIVQLNREQSWTLEDLLPPELYASALRDLLELPPTELFGTSLEHPYKENANQIIVDQLGREMPGPIAVAEHLLINLEEAEFAMTMSTDGCEALVDLHMRLLAALQVPSGRHEA